MLIGTVLALGSLAARPASAQEAFSVVLIPDTQNYSEFSSYGVYPHQMQWIANNQAARNIKFAVHLGDITNHDTAVEYDVASGAHAAGRRRLPLQHGDRQSRHLPERAGVQARVAVCELLRSAALPG
jgi:hypothetical protein